jgi:hypothetical protein
MFLSTLLGNMTGNDFQQGRSDFTDEALWFSQVTESSYLSQCFQVVQNKTIFKVKSTS